MNYLHNTKRNFDLSVRDEGVKVATATSLNEKMSSKQSEKAEILLFHVFAAVYLLACVDCVEISAAGREQSHRHITDKCM